MMFRAEEWGLRERGANPCLSIAKNSRRGPSLLPAHLSQLTESLFRNPVIFS